MALDCPDCQNRIREELKKEARERRESRFLLTVVSCIFVFGLAAGYVFGSRNTVVGALSGLGGAPFIWLIWESRIKERNIQS